MQCKCKVGDYGNSKQIEDALEGVDCTQPILLYSRKAKSGQCGGLPRSSAFTKVHIMKEGRYGSKN